MNIYTHTHMYKMHAPSKYAKGTYIWLGTAPCLMRGDPFKCLGGQWFQRNTIVDRASAQNLLESTSMVRTPSISVQFSLSVTPLSSGVWGVVSSCLMPSLVKYVVSSVEVYSPPLSERKVLMFLPLDLSTRAFLSLNRPNTSFLCFRI